jgi:hypothetical protein
MTATCGNPVSGLAEPFPRLRESLGVAGSHSTTLYPLLACTLRSAPIARSAQKTFPATPVYLSEYPDLLIHRAGLPAKG